MVNGLGCDKHNRARSARERMVGTHTSHDPSPSPFWHEVLGSVPKLFFPARPHRGCQSALFSLSRVFAVISQMFRITPHVLNDLT